MIQRVSVFIASMLCVVNGWAQDDYAAIALEAKRLAPTLTATYRQDAENAFLQAQRSNETNSQFAAFQDKMTLQPASQKTATQSVVIFVSFSMPRQSLVAYLRDAERIHASVVIRGFVNNSFKETFKTISTLVQEAEGGGIEINPLAFKTFKIQNVPTVVVIEPSNPCVSLKNCKLDRDYDAISGNITLQAALRAIRDHGIVANHLAESALQRLNRGVHG